MAKKSKLLEEIAKRPMAASATGIRPWHERLQAVEPEFCKEVLEIIDRFNARDREVAMKFRSASALAEWLVPRITEQGVRTSRDSVSRTIRERSNGKT